MSGMGLFVKVLLACVVVLAAASGTDVVDVLAITESVTEKAQSYVGGVDVDADETGLFDERIDPETGETMPTPEFARPSDKSGAEGALAFTEGSESPADGIAVDDAVSDSTSE